MLSAIILINIKIKLDTPSPEVTEPICRVPSILLSQTP